MTWMSDCNHSNNFRPTTNKYLASNNIPNVSLWEKVQILNSDCSEITLRVEVDSETQIITQMLNDFRLLNQLCKQENNNVGVVSVGDVSDDKHVKNVASQWHFELQTSRGQSRTDWVSYVHWLWKKESAEVTLKKSNVIWLVLCGINSFTDYGIFDQIKAFLPAITIWAVDPFQYILNDHLKFTCNSSHIYIKSTHSGFFLFIFLSDQCDQRTKIGKKSLLPVRWSQCKLRCLGALSTWLQRGGQRTVDT